MRTRNARTVITCDKEELDEEEVFRGPGVAEALLGSRHEGEKG